MDFNPTESLKRVLGPSPRDPWAALIPQILLWSFRRFCINIITVYEGSLHDSIWDDHIELIQKYCPRGLEEAAIEWMSPENLQTMSSSLEEYNTYFTEFMKTLDAAIEQDDYAIQDEYSEFLDTKISTVIGDWLNDNPFCIFPMEQGAEDEFNSVQMRSLINSLLTHISKPHTKKDAIKQEQIVEKLQAQAEVRAEAQEVQAEAQEEVKAEEESHLTAYVHDDPFHKPPDLLWHYMSVPLMPLFMTARPFYPIETIVQAEENVQTKEPSQPANPVPTVARAIAHRRTIRSKRRTEMVRVKTRRSHPTL